MTDEDLKKLVDVSAALLSWREELLRYRTERYLNKESENPTINVVISNHPTYLRDFSVNINDPEARATIKAIMLAEIRHRIRSLETKLRHLKGK